MSYSFVAKLDPVSNQTKKNLKWNPNDKKTDIRRTEKRGNQKELKLRQCLDCIQKYKKNTKNDEEKKEKATLKDI